MNIKNIWQKILSPENHFDQGFSWFSKSKKIIESFFAASHGSPKQTPKKEPVLEEPKVSEEIIPEAELGKGGNIPPHLRIILNNAPINPVEAALIQQDRIRKLYGTAALQGAAIRFFKDRRVKSVLPSGVEQVKYDIRFMDEERRRAISMAAPEYRYPERGLYLALSEAFIQAADPQGKTMNVKRLQSQLSGQGFFFGEAVVKNFEEALGESLNALKNPLSNVVAFNRPRDPDGMK